MQKTLLVVGGGVEAVPGILRAKELGLRVAVSDGRPDAPGLSMADHGLITSTYDAHGTLDAVRALVLCGYPVNGVIALAADVPVTVATVAQALGLPGLPLEVARLGQDKLAMKQRLQALGILTARGIEMAAPGDLHQAAAFGQGTGYVIVKPTDSRGARGVQRVSALPGEIRAALAIAKAQSHTNRAIVEEWLPGPQVSTETVICSNGRAVTPGFLDRNYDRLEEFAPYVIEDGADATTRLSPADRAAVIALAEKAALAVTGGVPCTVKGDLVLTPNGPAVIELALRLSGGYMSSTLVPLNTGVDLVGAAIRLALGETVTAEFVTPLHDRPVAIRYQVPPGCTSHPERLSHGIRTGATRDEAIHNARMLCDAPYRYQHEAGRRA